VDIQGKGDLHSQNSMLIGFRSAMGMAAIGVALYKYVMKFSPLNGSYFNRDRFVLSNGKLKSLFNNMR
jgi:transketolase N-terminal domain/subunit